MGYQSQDKVNPKPFIYAGVGVFALLALLVLWPISMVGTGERGVVTHFGKVQPGVLDEGMHFRMPIMTSIHKISVRIQKTTLTTEASSKDLQSVHSEVAINWHVNPAEVNTLYQQVGDEDSFVTSILMPSVSEVFKAATSKKTAEEIITRRNELADDTYKMLKERLAAHNVILDTISVVNLQFSKEFSHAIERKQVAEQEAKQAEYVAQKATADAKAKVNTAHGDAEATLTNAKAQAESQKLLRQSVSPELLQLKAIERWDGSMPQVLGNGSGLLFNIPVNGKAAPKAKTQEQGE